MDQAKTSQSQEQPTVQEFVVRIPNKDANKKYNVMRFNKSLNINIPNWKQVKMERENNMKEFKPDEDNPKFGAGSEFGREQKEEARRKKHGIILKQYNPDDQPWMMRMGGKGGKRYKGQRDGGVTENASYYMFTKAANGVFEAYPVEEFYAFMPVSCFKPLSAEEAELEYCKRDQVLNFFSIMVRKKLQASDAADDEDDEEKKTGSKKKKKPEKDFKISDMDDCPQLDHSGESDNDDDSTQDSKSGKKKPVKKTDKKKKKNDSDDEALEESDEGDFDDKEMDYITSGSSEEEEFEEDDKANNELKGVEDEAALRQLNSDEEEEEEEPNKETEENAENKEKASEQKPKQKQKKSDSSGESSSDTSDSDLDDGKFNSAIFVSKSKKKNSSDNNSTGSSRANTPTKLQGDREGQKSLKRRYPEVTPSNVKKPKVESQASGSSSMSNTLDAINEDSVRRYLKRKPMTASELLQKFKSKKITKVNSDQLVTKIADVLKRMDLHKANRKGKMYLSLNSKKD